MTEADVIDLNDIPWDQDSNRIFYAIIWTKEHHLTVACMQWFDVWDYTLASQTEYENQDQAYGDAIALGVKHNVEVDLSRWFPILPE